MGTVAKPEVASLSLNDPESWLSARRSPRPLRLWKTREPDEPAVMDRALTELELAELSTADWEARCQRQKAVVADLKAKGLNACYAEAVLLQWKRTLTLMREHLARLREEQEAR